MTQLNVNNVSADSTIRQEKKSHYFILCVNFKKKFFFCQFAIFNHVSGGFGNHPHVGYKQAFEYLLFMSYCYFP